MIKPDWSKPDWSKAPEWAEAYAQVIYEHQTTAVDFAWISRNGYFYNPLTSGRDKAEIPCHPFNEDVRLSEFRVIEFRPLDKPAIQEAWAGEGLPPVGTVCEHKRVHQWTKVEVFAVKPNYNGSQTALFTYENGCWGGCAEPSFFRPILTPEQIAADELQRAVQQIMVDAGITDSALKDDPEAWVWAQALHEAGYRKQVAP